MTKAEKFLEFLKENKNKIKEGNEHIKIFSPTDGPELVYEMLKMDGRTPNFVLLIENGDPALKPFVNEIPGGDWGFVGDKPFGEEEAIELLLEVAGYDVPSQ